MLSLGDILRAALTVMAIMALSGCVQKMADQPRYEPLEASDFFDDGRSERPLVEGTIARGQLQLDDHFYRGRVKGELATTLPMKMSLELLERGQQRFNIFCAPCHDRAGTGSGMIVRRGYAKPPHFAIDRLREAPVGHFFDVMTNGYRQMPDYAAQVPPEDRWAIAAYIRALQFSQHASRDEVPAAELTRLEGAAP